MMRVDHLFYFPLMTEFTVQRRKNGLDKGTLMLIPKFIALGRRMTVVTTDLSILGGGMGRMFPLLHQRIVFFQMAVNAFYIDCLDCCVLGIF